MSCRNEKIYGVGPDEKITPEMVRDAMVECFRQAGKGITDYLDAQKEGKEDPSAFQAASIVRSAFRQSGGDFDNPSKKSLEKAMDYLARIVSSFREPEIIEKNYADIKSLVDRLG